MSRTNTNPNIPHKDKGPCTAPPRGKYAPYSERFPVKLEDRTWPDKHITAAPQWCAVDLRDGNQALPRPMSVREKLGFFEVLKKVGFKQVEVGYPAANQDEFDFVRQIIESKLIPEEVTPQVLTMDRGDLIQKTFDALRGVHRAIIHIYRPTSIDQRELFFRMTKDQVMQAAVDSTRLVRRLAARFDAPVQLQFSPESFTGTELDFALEVVNAVVRAWDPQSDEKVIINLPATVELSRPNTYADQIEWMSRFIERRERVIISLHTHNDRGTAVAATELGLQAGAERVEGTLFGNGERTGNLDIINLALNLYREGIDPGLDISNVPWLIAEYQKYTGMTVPPRHVVGELAFTAFSGGHQAAIKPGLEYQKTATDPQWRVPYLSLDPKDVGLEYAPVRLNDQSGKYGVAYCLEHTFGCRAPQAMLAELADMVKQWCHNNRQEVQPETLWRIFEERFIKPDGDFKLIDYVITREGSEVTAALTVSVRGGESVTVTKRGNGPIDAAAKALKQLGYSFEIRDFNEHSRGDGPSADAVAYVQVSSGERALFGVGINSSTECAGLEALVAAVNRLSR